MTIAKEFAAKLSVAIVAVAMVFSAFASSASAQTAEELLDEGEEENVEDVKVLGDIAQYKSQTFWENFWALFYKKCKSAKVLSSV